MAINITPYTDQELSVLVEEYITQQRSEFALKGLYAYIVYWGMEDKRIVGDQLTEADKVRVNAILNRIVKDGRISVKSDVEYLKSGFSENRVKLV